MMSPADTLSKETVPSAVKHLPELGWPCRVFPPRLGSNGVGGKAPAREGHEQRLGRQIWSKHSRGRPPRASIA